MKYAWVLLVLWGCPETPSPPVTVIQHDTVRVTDTVRLTRTIHDSIMVRDTVKAIILDTVRVTVPVIVPVSDSAVVVRWDTLDVSAWGVTNSTCLQGGIPDAEPIDSLAYRRHLASADTASWLCPRGRWLQGGEWITAPSGRICRGPLPAKRTDPPKRWYCGWVWK